MNGSRDPSHFAALYQSNPDPWNFRSDAYEQAKYRHTIEVLADRRYTAALEIGCSIGVLTRMLAPLCDTLLGLDIVEAPLKDAATLCADQPWVQFRRMQVPAEWPAQRFDLILFSEMLYFLTPEDIDRCADRAAGCLLPDSRMLLVNWLGRSDDPCTGDQAADRFIGRLGGRILRQERRERYRLDLLGQ